MSSIMRARSGLMGRGEPSEVMGLSRAKGCWTFDARDRMPRPSRATAHHLSEIAPTATPAPLPRAGSFNGATRSPRRVSAKDRFPHPEPTPGAGTKRQILVTVILGCGVAVLPRARYGPQPNGFTGSLTPAPKEEVAPPIAPLLALSMPAAL